MRTGWQEYGRPALFFLITTACVYFHGAFSIDRTGHFFHDSVADGLLLVAGVIGIMLAHEMGHYLACRYYRVDASLPYFLPGPLISLVGTFGAFIRIRAPFPHRRALFDIGVAGPIAGFVVTLIVLALSFYMIELEPAGSGPGEAMFNFPLLFDLAQEYLPYTVPEAPAGMRATVNQSLALAAWFGAFLTALNLMPVGQLDGGHAIYALMGRKAILVSRVAFWACVGLIYFSPSWIVWCLLLHVLGGGHPVTLDEAAPVGRGRVAVGIATLAIFVLCFMPTPIIWGTWGGFFAWVRSQIATFLT